MMRAVITDLYRSDGSTSYSCPLFLVPVSAGYPSPADDFQEETLNLHEHLVKHEAATFFVRVQGDSMIGAGIHTDDLLIVDRALEPTDNSVVIAVVNGELTLKRISKKDGKLSLVPDNGNYKPIPVTESTDFEVWGVVTHVIHAV